MSSDRPPRPEALDVKPDDIPDKLKSRNQWVCWRYEWRDDDDDWTKPPLNANTSDDYDYASSTDSDTWASFEDALDYHERSDTDTDGVGIAIHDGGLIVGLDCDDCRDPETGEYEAWVDDILDTVPTYAEVSPSETGFRPIGVGLMPDDGNRADIEDAEGHLEMYETGRYLTITGHHVEGTPEDIQQVKDGILDVHAEYIADDETDESGDAEGRSGDSSDVNPTPDGAKTDLDDDELLEKAKNAENGEKFRRLWQGRDVAGLDGNGGQNERDLALASLLAFWTGGDRRQIDRLFRQSGLYREKWDRDDYRGWTLDKALDGTEFYSPDSGGPPTVADGGAAAASASADGPTIDESDDIPEWDDLPHYGQRGGVDTRTTRRDAAKILLENHEFATPRPEGAKLGKTPLYHYWPEEGFFERGGAAWLNRYVGRKIPELEHADIKEIINKVKRETYVKRDTFDAGRYGDALINLKNGVYNLDTGELLDHSPDYRFRTSIPRVYDPDAECPNITEFIHEIVPGEAERRTLFEWIGYCLEIGYPIHRFLILYGGGRNGKSRYFALIREFLESDNVSGVTLDTITSGGFGLAALDQNLLNVDTESADTRLKPSELSVIKALSGGDQRQIDVKFEEPFELENACKLAFAANNPPRFAEDTDAVADRLLTIELPWRFANDDNADKEPIPERELMQQLTTDEELSGLLNKALEGLQRIRERGYFTIEEGSTSRERLEHYRAEADSIVGFAKRCLKNEANFAIPKTAVYSAYKSYCGEHGHTPAEESAFFRQLGRKGDIETHSKRPRVKIEGTSSNRPTVLDHLWITPKGLAHLSRGARDDTQQVISHMHEGNEDFAYDFLLRTDIDDGSAADAEQDSEREIPQADKLALVTDVIDDLCERGDGTADRADITNALMDEGISQPDIQAALDKLTRQGEIYQPADAGLGQYALNR